MGIVVVAENTDKILLAHKIMPEDKYERSEGTPRVWLCSNGLFVLNQTLVCLCRRYHHYME